MNADLKNKKVEKNDMAILSETTYKTSKLASNYNQKT